MPSAAERALTRERLRRRRDALLLELGGLVYELHRQGRRAPELLHAKAGELAELDEQLAALDDGPTGDAPSIDSAIGTQPTEHDSAVGRESACPACGHPAQPGQLVCLNCGSRLDLGRKPSSLLPALAALIAVVVVGAGAFGFAVSELTSDGDSASDEVAADEGETRTLPYEELTGTEARTEAAPATEPQAGTESAPGAAQQPTRSLLLDWPDDLTAHTVVLVTTSDRAAALRIARGAARSGIETGLLSSDDYDLGSDLWIVFAGRFDTRRGAARQAANLGDRYPGAYVQLVQPVG